jgi:hypothetical protein
VYIERRAEFQVKAYEQCMAAEYSEYCQSASAMDGIFLADD